MALSETKLKSQRYHNTGILFIYTSILMGATWSKRASHEPAEIVPRLCRIQKIPGCDSYGFNLHAEKDMVGYIGNVDNGSPAEIAGLKRGDRVLQVNGNSVSLDDIYQVAERIMERTDVVELLVIAPAPGDPLPQLVRSESVKYKNGFPGKKKSD